MPYEGGWRAFAMGFAEADLRRLDAEEAKWNVYERQLEAVRAVRATGHHIADPVPTATLYRAPARRAGARRA